jgi:hypothetical protein
MNIKYDSECKIILKNKLKQILSLLKPWFKDITDDYIIILDELIDKNNFYKKDCDKIINKFLYDNYEIILELASLDKNICYNSLFLQLFNNKLTNINPYGLCFLNSLFFSLFKFYNGPFLDHFQLHDDFRNLIHPFYDNLINFENKDQCKIYEYTLNDVIKFDEVIQHSKNIFYNGYEISKNCDIGATNIYKKFYELDTSIYNGLNPVNLLILLLRFYKINPFFLKNEKLSFKKECKLVNEIYDLLKYKYIISIPYDLIILNFYKEQLVNNNVLEVMIKNNDEYIKNNDKYIKNEIEDYNEDLLFIQVFNYLSNKKRDNSSESILYEIYDILFNPDLIINICNNRYSLISISRGIEINQQGFHSDAFSKCGNNWFYYDSNIGYVNNIYNQEELKKKITYFDFNIKLLELLFIFKKN